MWQLIKLSKVAFGYMNLDLNFKVIDLKYFNYKYINYLSVS